MPVTPVAGNTHQSSTFGKLLEPGLRKVFFETYDELPEQFTQVFKIKTSKKAKETDYGLSSFDVWAKRATGLDNVTYGKIDPGLERTYTHEEFTGGFMVERKFVDDEMYDVINKMPAALARDGRYKVEADAANLFNNGFSEDVGGVGASAIYDGKALFAADHALLKGGTCSNLVNNGAAAPLSDTNLKSAITLMRNTRNEANQKIVYQPGVLVVPPNLEWLAMELTKSQQKPGTNLNDINTLMGRLKVFVWDFLSDTDAWFVMDEKRHEANFFWRVKPEFKNTEDFDTLVAKYRGYMRYSFGVSDWRGIVGSAG